MEREVVINRVLRDMKMQEILSEENEPFAIQFLNAVYVAAWEARGKELLAHNKKKVIQYNRENIVIGEFDSILEAAELNECNRDVIDDSISGRANFTRRGHYFRYAENEKSL
jgi:hypothetical protein